MFQSVAQLLMLFQSTPLYEGRLGFRNTLLSFSMFQSTPLYEGRRRRRERGSQCPQFQSTPLYEGRPAYSRLSLPPSPCFNPRPCTRGDSARHTHP